MLLLGNLLSKPGSLFFDGLHMEKKKTASNNSEKAIPNNWIRRNDEGCGKENQAITCIKEKKLKKFHITWDYKREENFDLIFICFPFQQITKDRYRQMDTL